VKCVPGTGFHSPKNMQKTSLWMHYRTQLVHFCILSFKVTTKDAFSHPWVCKNASLTLKIPFLTNFPVNSRSIPDNLVYVKGQCSIYGQNIFPDPTNHSPTSDKLYQGCVFAYPRMRKRIFFRDHETRNAKMHLYHCTWTGF